MANTGDELILGQLPPEDHEDYFDALVRNCIKAFSIVYSDSVALDACGVVDKRLRVQIVENDTYRKQTKSMKARRTIDDLSDYNTLMREIDYDDEEDGAEPKETTTVKPYDPFGVSSGVEVDNQEQKLNTGQKRKLFDKSKMEMKLKLITQRRELLNAAAAEEDKEAESLNIFFVPITQAQFEEMKNIELSATAGDTGGAFNEDKELDVVKAMKKRRGEGSGDELDGGTAYHYEKDEWGDPIIVEN